MSKVISGLLSGVGISLLLLEPSKSGFGLGLILISLVVTLWWIGRNIEKIANK